MKLKVIFIYFYLFLFIFSFSLVCSKNVLEPIDLSSELGLSENIVGYDINCVKTETSVLKNYLITFKSNSSYLDLNGNFFEDIKPSLKERNSFLRLNEEGNILEADFISTGGNYTINGIKFNTPKNSRVLYNNEKGIILEGINSNFLSPIFSLGTSEKITFKGKNVILPNNEFLESGEIKFNGKNYYVEKGDDFKIKGVNVMGVSSNKNIYFDGKDYGENSISFGETNLIAKSGDNLNFKFDKNNPYSKVEENDYFGIDLNKNSEFNLEKQEDFSDLKVKGENLVVHQGRKDIIYDGNQIYVQNIKSRIGQGTSPLKLSFDNSDILKEKEIWIDDYGAISIMDVDLNENDFFNGEDSSKNVGINEVCAPMNKGLMQSSIVEFEGEKYYIDPVEYIKAMEKYEKDYSNYEWELGLRDLDKQILMTSDSNSKYFDYSGVELFDKFKKTFNDEQDLQDYLDKCWKLDSKIVQKRIDKASEEFIQDYEFVKFYYIDKGEKIYPSREVVSWFFSMSKEGYDENFKVNTFNKLNFPLNFEKPFFLLKDKVSGKIVLVELENLQKLKSSFIKKYPECVSSILIRSTSSYAVLQEDFLNNYDPIYHELDDLIELSSAECDLKAIQFYFENTFSYHGRKYNSYLKSIEEMVKEMGKKTSWEKIKNSFKLPKGGEIKEGIV
ncbi:MAG: hypothetical protein U9Q99_02510, partial [Nanoarchaeota archaeon]|nr:hypothetical protein [Nanoarchaeota archaeon]